MSYFNNGSSIEVLEENNYYPFGLKHEGYNALAGNSAYQYKYNGKELQETGMYDYGARFYMPDIGRWGVVDPLSEKGHNFSPYNYAINNPIRFIDPDGLWIGIIDEGNRYRYSNGQTQQQIDGKWQAIDKNVQLSDNVVAIVAGLQALENGGDAGRDLVSYFDNDKHDVNIMYDKGNTGEAGYKQSDPIKIDPKERTKTPTAFDLKESPFFVSLGHELGHKRDENNYLLSGNWFGVSRGEIFASHIENMIRAENGLLLRSSYTTNPKIFGGLDLQTVLIDCAGNSLYYNQFGKALENVSIDDRSNAARSVYGTTDSSILKRRYNYYDNIKRTNKK
ncbi:RHS repeat-associated core domain-containing protein [Chryseobacterium taichungense]|uniref:RHS repeat-associated core domain-containing protein n=1 Tax=Chryseobacterium taichungense TaxID=295069 RepID=A0A1H8ACR3_9FLAO|nr:RHS repeat-associated core domain-containing protein [Chryseobacterium taichungense]